MFCQQVEVRADNKPLNEVLIGISGTYGIQLSFDDRSLSKFSVTLSETFDSPESALLKLLEGLPFELNKNGEVFVIIKKKNPARARSFSINGLILEKGTMEPLPYSLVSINGNALAADLKGSFSYISSTDSIFQVKASHLGYYILDTVVNAGATVHFLLSPSVIGLSEVVIKNSVIERTTQAGREAGVMKLNHQVANFLPGFGDNSVFNLLRLQPGILASGEETNDLIIWGCYEGQSKVLFDGFTIYGLKNFNDNISSFNPLMAKDIEVYKGGYDARFGERVGGIVNVTGKNGNMEKTSFSVNLNNMTLNGMVEIPVGKSGSLVFALRHTYYELYNPGDVNSVLKQAGRDSLNNVDVNIVPDYRFRDLNLKYSAKIHDQDLFYISLYAGNDKFSYSIDQPVNNLYITKNTQEKNTQSGGSVFYGKNWKNGYSTNFSFTYSNLKSNYTDDLTVEKIQQQQIKNKSNLVAENIIRENTIQVDNRFPINESNILEGGLYLIGNRIELQEDTFNIQQASFDDQARRVTIYFQDNVSFIKKIDVKAGFRLTQAINLSRLYLEPRISTSVKLGEMFRINAAWGIYDQFVTKSSIVDDMGNYRYIWTVCNNEDIPILNAMHYVLGTSFNYNAWTVSLEGYYKDVSGLTRYVRNTANNLEGIYQGQGRSYGLDVMVKKDYKWFSGWVSYTLGKTEELFEYFITEEYRRAPQDQRHEVKLAALFNVDPFYFSADYVFGSGFPATRQILDQNPDNLTYSRLDVAAIYKFLDRRIKGEAGLSVLNVLNTENIKYANFERVSTKQTNSINIYSEAIPITPALYLKISM
jgi:hypothetical protein